jgi:hypothetical protein
MRLNVRRALPAAICAGALLLSMGPAGAVTAPSATVKPAKALTNGKVVTVTWSNFNATKDKTIAIVECNSKVATDMEAACDTADVQLVNPGTASGHVKLTLRTGAIGTDGGTCGTSKADAKNCVVAVSGLTKKLTAVPKQNATVAIAFKP